MARKILIVEDEADLREMLEEIFVISGFEVATAENGTAALNYLENSDLPGIILLDLTMPIMSGSEFLAELYSGRHSNLEGVPVAIVSAVADLWLPPKSYNCVAQIRKPADLATLLSMARTYI